MFKRKLVSVFLCVSVVITMLALPLSANAVSEESISAPSAVLMEVSTGKILFEKNPHEQRPCASITKVMTMLLVCEAIDSDKLSLEDTITASAHA
ncbi:MAG: serine hydrolase, partial [Ruminococcus sp.]|nr:serine hydrolase [Ruminococcus sp.]